MLALPIIVLLKIVSAIFGLVMVFLFILLRENVEVLLWRCGVVSSSNSYLSDSFFNPLINTHCSKKAKKPTRHGNTNNARRKGKRVHSDK